VTRAALVLALGTALAAVASAAGSPSGTVQATVLVNPMSVAVVVPTDPQKTGKDFRVRADVTNSGASALQNVSVTLLAPPALVLRDPVTQVLPSVMPAQVRSVKWDVCTTSAGGYVLMARASVGPFTTESSGQVVQVTSAKRASC
jgi:hypothetical protein